MRWYTLYQYDNEDLTDYVKRLKQARDICKALVGTEIIHKAIEQTERYKIASDEDKARYKTESFDYLDGLLLIRGCNRKKYGSLVKGLESQYALGQDQYPKTLKAGIDILSRTNFDDTYNKYNKKAKGKPDRSDKTEKKKKDKDKLPKKKKDGSSKEPSFAQGEIVCYCCGLPGHISPNCPKKDKIARNKWHVNKLITSNFQQETNRGL